MIFEIETEEDYQQGLRRFLEIAGSHNSEEEKELILLMELMEKYERNNCSSS
ncbi:MAG: hypothetical protein R2757_13400 [Draconibacterium sp.]|jgi:hypothetical protein